VKKKKKILFQIKEEKKNLQKAEKRKKSLKIREEFKYHFNIDSTNNISNYSNI